MNQTLIISGLIYFVIISIITIIFTVCDKKRAIKHKYRVPEAKLFLLAFLGGAIAEYFTMKKIRHKTKHKQFMLGLPAIISLQIASLAFCIYYILT